MKGCKYVPWTHWHVFHYLVLLFGVWAGEYALKAPLIHDLHFSSNSQTQNLKVFPPNLHFLNLFQPNSFDLTRCNRKECKVFWALYLSWSVRLNGENCRAHFHLFFIWCSKKLSRWLLSLFFILNCSKLFPSSNFGTNFTFLFDYACQQFVFVEQTHGAIFW
jgi:hypothetical protein